MSIHHFVPHSLATLVVMGLALLAAPAFANTLTVTTNAEPAALDTDDCSANICATLRGAINHAAQNSGADTIVFDASLDGQTIIVDMYTNCLTTSDSGNATCLPPAAGAADNGWPGSPAYVSQFGPSAFFIHDKTLTIDATANGMTMGVVIARDTSADNFRLFDVDPASSLTLRGLSLSNGTAKGGDSHFGGGAMGAGGAVFNQGDLNLEQCTLTGNEAIGGAAAISTAGYGGAGVGQTRAGYGGGGPNGYPDPGDGYENGGFGGGGTGASGGGLGGGGGFGGGGGDGGFGGFGGGGGGHGGDGGFGGGHGNVFGSGGSGAGFGGAIFNDAGAVNLANATLAYNQAIGGHNNGAINGSGFGGAIFNYHGSLSLESVTLANNTVDYGNATGGAIYSLGDSLAKCSAGGNTCTSSGATLIMNRSIAAGSGGRDDVVLKAINGGGNNSSGADNLIENQTGFDGSIVSSADPQLGTLPVTLHGGLTDVMVPQAGSPVINAASSCGSAATDQRDMSRPQGRKCDVGAVEMEAIRYALNVGVAGAGNVSAGATPLPESGGIVTCTSFGGDCAATYLAGDEVHLIASASPGTHFVSWAGACSGTADTYVTMNADKSCFATFATDANFSIGGPVNGLAGTGLVLQLNGGNPLTINPTDAGFAFTSGLPAPGQSYEVTVSVQPTAPAQICNVINGAGTMSGADVTDVVVLCTTSHYTIGGTVSNLTGSGLTLQLNGGPDLPVTGNGIFNFDTVLASGSAYTVRVATQPTNPVQVCSVGNASGIVSNANVSDVTVTCEDAAAQLSLSIDDGHDFARYGRTLDYLVTLDNTGNATASSVAVTSTSTGLGSAAAHWQCIGANNGATCTTSNTGPFADTATVPAGRSLSWIVTVPVLTNAPGESVEMSVQATGASSATDVDTLVIFRDGFDVANADGTRVVTPAPDSAGVLRSDGSDTFPVPPATGNGITTIKTLRDGDATIKIQRLVLGQAHYVRLLQHPQHGEERASAWVPAAVNAILSVGSVADKQGDRIVLLDGATQPSSLRLAH